jgi:hypothetical protein
LLVVLGLALTLFAATASAADFSAKLGEEYTFDTSALTLTGPGGLVTTGADQGGIAVFSFDNVSIEEGAEVFAEGSRPLEIKAAGAFTLGGSIEASGFDASDGSKVEFPGGPGGGAGGAEVGKAGSGPGGGGASQDSESGGAGGGFGGRGAAGGEPGGGAPGVAYGDLNLALQGGSGGAGGSNTGGGGGGGGIELSAASLTIDKSGEVLAFGGNGQSAGDGASGGGSGGAIILNALTLKVSGFLDAEGGAGGGGGCCGDGGGGGGGRIAYQYGTLEGEGEAIVAGGESGVINLPHGGESPDPAGASGVITKTQVASAATSAASSIAPTGATLNGTVNPNGAAATYHFELGTSTAYGTKIPASDAAVGSDSSAHAVSQAVTGLAPATTYHYRVVASSLGLTSVGSDMTFTTAPAFAGAKLGKGKVKVKNGAAFITLSSVLACKGKITLSGRIPASKARGKAKGKAGASKKKGHKAVKLGSASFTVAAGKSTTVKVPLSAAAKKALKAGKKIKASVSIAATDSLGEKKTTSGKVTLAQRKKKKPKHK